MKTTKGEILTHLKQSGTGTVDGLASALGLARMTIRQHLSVLERDGLVSSRLERQRTGRPHLLFSLSDLGQESFPKQYDRLADLMLQEVAFLEASEIEGLSHRDKKQVLLKKMAENAYSKHRTLVEGKSLQERVKSVAQLLNEEGGLAEWKADGQRYEIIVHNCVYRRVADSQDSLCEFDVVLLSRLLGQDVQCEEFLSQGGDCCRFVVREEVSEQ